MGRAITKQAELVHAAHGKCLTDSLLVAEKFGKRHKNVLQAIEKLDCPVDFRRLNFQPSSYENQQGKEQPKYVITRDGFTILAMGFTGREAMRWKLAFLEAFNRMERELLRVRAQKASPDWRQVRLESAAGYNVMCDILSDVRREYGKATKPHHFVNEAKLLNGLLTGKFKGIERDKLSGDELALLADLQRRDALLLARGVPYQERKAALQAYLGERRPLLAVG